MNSPSDRKIKIPKELDSLDDIFNGIERNGHLGLSDQGEVEGKHRLVLVQWLNSLVPSLDFSTTVTDGELRASLSNGTVLCQILNKLRPGSVTMVSESDHSLPSQSENVRTFLKALDGLGCPRFEISDLEKGSMKPVVDCLLILRIKSLMNTLGENVSSTSSTASSPRGYAASSFHYSPPFSVDKRRASSESRFHHIMSSPVMAEPSASLIYQVGNKFHEVFQIKPRSYADLPAAKISEMMKSNSLDNAPTQSLLSVVNGILEESVERRNGEIPHRVACLLRKVSQEIERRISTQAEHLRTQSNLFKAREEKYQSRIRVLEAIASGNKEESEIFFASQRQQLKVEKIKEEEKKENEKKMIRLMKMLEDKNLVILELTQKLEATKSQYETQCSQLEDEAGDAKAELRQKSQEYEHQSEELRNEVKELETSSDSKYQEWNMKKNQLQAVVNFQFSSLQKLKLSWESIRQDVMNEQTVYAEECNRLGVNLKPLIHASQNYQVILAENKKMFNEIQELKGNIRVFCRIRPFLTGKKETHSVIEDIGENDLVVENPSKGKDALRSFKFNKIFGPSVTQGDVYSDIQPFVRSVLDGYNVCMFAYGQTGSGKTYTMTGPSGATNENLGVNYRALNDLFRISTSRAGFTGYEIWVQMVEIYNEQVRDFFFFSGFLDLHTLGILTQSQSNGIAVPDASMFPVKSPSDVIKLMDIGLKNRAIGATAMNERSSRSHSVVSIHVRGKDFRSGSTLHGNLHLVDLAGSERVDRSEVTGDRLREAQHINKSLSALGDVIFALSQKSSHVPYRNSKLTQLLQNSLGGQAKTLMFVQINSDASSYSETLSTLKFAERVSSIELGAARNSKEARELMEQVTCMKNTISKKDEEIERLKSLNAPVGGISKQIQKQSSGSFKHLVEDTGLNDRSSEISDNHSLALGNETDGSSDNSIRSRENRKTSDNMKKSKVLTKPAKPVRKLGRIASNAGIDKDSLKKAPGLTKSPSISHIKASKRWQ
ncbi:unnamed protein product [Vicia faba]|uniref:Uncharacterized protein n=1 Tax=Vicia faba TaxID=3906 RepID=A0AAV1BDX2_VICFA|nr:unnamed protein product [Vicia faba]